MINLLPGEEGHYWQGQYAVFESLLASAAFNEAEKKYQEISLANDIPADLFTSFKLRYQLLQVQTYSLEDINAALKYFEETGYLEGASAYNRALALSLYCKGILLGIAFGVFSADKKPLALQILEHATRLFYDDNYKEDYQNNLLLLADSYKKKPFRDPATSELMYKRLLESGLTTGDLIMEAHARLNLLELEFKEKYKPGISDAELERLISSFEAIAELFRLGGHLIPQAIVDHRFGSLLLEYGLDAGLSYIESAIKAYTEHNFLAEAQILTREISTWYLRHGETRENIATERRAALLDEKVSVSLGGKVSYLAKIDQAYRQGNIGLARTLYNEAAQLFDGHPLRGQLDSLHANNLAKAGLVEESLAIFKQIVEDATDLKVSNFLSDAYTNLANNLMQVNLREAEMYIAKAIQIDEQLGDDLSKVQHIQILIQILASQEKSIPGMPLKIPVTIDTCFQECAKILANNFTLEGRMKTGEVLQTKGRMLFMAKRMDEAIAVFKEAEKIFEPAKLNGHLSFLYAHYGMTLVEQARASSSEILYDEAKEKILNALHLFENAYQRSEQARMLGLAGICEYESGKLVTTQELSRIKWDAAEDYFEKSYRINRILRINTDHSSELSRQLSMIAYGRDNLTYPTQAFYMHYQWTKNNFLAIKWLERTKAQALVESMLHRQISIKDSNEDVGGNLVSIQDQYDDIVQRVQFRLKDNNTLIILYYCTASLLLVYGLKKDWNSPKLITIPISNKDLQDFTQQYFAKATDHDKSTIYFDSGNLWQHFKMIISPVEDWCVPGDKIFFIPHGVLHQLPLQILKTSDNRYLIERNPVAYCQSLSVLLNVSGSTVQNLEEKYVEDAVFGDSNENLRFAKLEARFVAEALGIQPILGKGVTRNAVLEKVPGARILHMCGHGGISEINGWNYSMKMANSEILSAMDIFQSHTHAELVVLSGCDTGANEYIEGDELSGLVRAFLYAGAKNLVVSQWQVDDGATAELFDIFYSILNEEPGISKMEVLQKTMKTMHSRRGPDVYLWGGFQIFSPLE